MPHVFFSFQGNAVLSILGFLGTGLLLLVKSTAILFLVATRRLIGHENSFFHKKASFQLMAREATSASSPMGTTP